MVTAVLPDGKEIELPKNYTQDQLRNAIKEVYGDEMPEYVTRHHQEQEEARRKKLDEMSAYLRQSVPGAIFGAGDAIGNMERNLLNLALPKGLQFGRAQTVSENHPGYKTGQVMGEMAAFLGAGGPASMALRGLSGVKGLGLLNRLTSQNLLPSVGRRALGSGIFSGIAAPEEKAERAAEGAAFSGLVDLGFSGAKALPKVPRALAEAFGRLMTKRTRKHVEDTFGPEWRKIMQERLAATGESKTPMGDFLRHPGTKRWYENFLSHLSEEGQTARAEVKRELSDEANQLFKGWRTQEGREIPVEQIDEKIKEGLDNVYKKEQKAKNKLYNHVNEIIPPGFKINLSRTNKIFDKVAPEMNSVEMIKSYEHRSNAFKQLGRVLKPKDPEKEIEILNEFGEPFRRAGRSKKVSLDSKSLNIVNLKQLATDMDMIADEMGKRQEGSTAVRKFAEALRADVRDSVAKLGPDAKKALADADRNYAEKFSHFLDPTLRKVLYGITPPSAIESTFIKRGAASDSVEMLKKITQVMDRGTLNLLKHRFFGTRAGGLKRALEGDLDIFEAQPAKFANAYKKLLGEQQKKALFPDKRERQQVSRLVNKIGMNPIAASEEAFEKAAIATGASNKELKRVLGATNALTIGIASGHLLSPFVLGGIYYLKKKGADAAIRYLNSPKTRQKLVQEMMKAEKLKKAPSPQEVNRKIEDIIRFVGASSKGEQEEE